MIKPTGLTVTILFEGQSLNYDEGYGNLSTLKKIHRGDGKTYTYSSRQSLRYSIFMQGKEQFGWIPSDVYAAGSGNAKVIQLVSDISESEESDLFGFMQTNVKVSDKLECTRTRVAPVKITPAISIEPFDSDVEMLTNKYQADKNHEMPNIANIETHRSIYRYTICIDLHKIGSEADDITNKIMPNGDAKKYTSELKNFIAKIRGNDIGNDIKCKRVSDLLDIIGSLYRDIKGRREDLKPLFIIGGIYETLNPFFENTVFVSFDDSKPKINPQSISQQLLSDNTIKSSTFIGIRQGYFANTDSDFSAAMEDNISSPEDVIKKLKAKVLEYYEQNR